MGDIFCMNCGQKLPAEAKFCFACGQRVETGGCQEAAVGEPENVPCQQGDMGSPAENDVKLTLAEFRERAPSQTGFREQLLAYRKSLPHNWDYNAYVGILLGASERSAARLTAQRNYAVGQGDNNKNTTYTIELRGLTAIYEKYRGKNISPSILLSDVEEEIVSAAPDYAEIRKNFHEIVFAGAGGNGSVAEVTAVLPHKNVGSATPVTEDAEETPHTEPAVANTENVSEIIDFFVEVLAFRVLAFVADDENIDRDDVREKFLKRIRKLMDIQMSDQQKFEAYFGTSPEAKWLYSARYVVNDSIPGALSFDGRLCVSCRRLYRYDIDKAVALLQELPEGKYGIAYYALAKCYGVGIDMLIEGICNSGDRVYVLRPDFDKMFGYLVKAVKAQKPEKEAIIDLGCIELSRCDYSRATQIFELAKTLGHQKAPIYLRYIECCKHAVPAINGQRSIPDSSNREQQNIFGNIVEYKGRVYWMYADKQNENPYSYMKTALLCSMGPEGKRNVLARMETDSFSFRGIRSSASDVGLAFSICDDLIYYENGSGGICTMRLDGSDKRELTDLSNHGKTEVCMPMAFPGFLLYVRWGDFQLFKRDQNGVKTKIRKLASSCSIVGVSEKEVNIDNKELIDLRTLERRKITEKYPALKKKAIFYIDMAREIAYYEENADTGDARDRRLIGVNTWGEIVDYWKIPSMPYNHTIGDGYNSLCFDGQKLSIKIDHVENAMKRKPYSISVDEYTELWRKQGLSEREWPFVALFDRRGNRRILCQIKEAEDSRYTFGGFHMMTEGGVVVLKCYSGEKVKEWWNIYYPISLKRSIPPTKLDRFMF